MPLLHTVGCSSTYKSFSASFAFMRSETTEDYRWALKCIRQTMGEDWHPEVFLTDDETALMTAIKEVFPNTTNLICAWHINKNLLKNHRGSFPKGKEGQSAWDQFLKAWNHVTYAATEDEFNARWDTFKNDAPPEAIEYYIERQWLPEKHRFVRAWTNKHRHLDHIVTSRGESAHYRIKGYINTSTGTLLTVFDSLEEAHENEFKEITTSIMQEKQRIEHKLSHKLFDNTRNRISNWALYHALDQHRKVIYAQIEGAEPLGPCSGAFEKTLGIPCRHTIAARLLLNQPLAMDDFIKQWVLQHPAKPSTSTSIIAKHQSLPELATRLTDASTLWAPHQCAAAEVQLTNIIETGGAVASGVKNPLQVVTKGRPKAKSAMIKRKRDEDVSTRRDPSAFEYVEALMGEKEDVPRRRKPYSCSRCGAEGHTARNRNCTGHGIVETELPASTAPF